MLVFVILPKNLIVDIKKIHSFIDFKNNNFTDVPTYYFNKKIFWWEFSTQVDELLFCIVCG